jgi:dTDP-4-dehydrorhamnose reductase
VRVLITGASGQVGSALYRSAPPGSQLQAMTRAELDIRDAPAVEAAVRAFAPQVIINAAAYTAVDRAEEESQLATAINAHGPAALARAAHARPGCRLLHISTDYVFDGRATRPYQPQDRPNPLSVYGRSKLQGEQAVTEQLGERAVILRTAWVYAAEGKNFLLTMLRLMRERGAVRVVADQLGTPTAADSVARALWVVASRPDIRGILHWTDAGTESWCGFATAIAQEAQAAGLVSVIPQVTAIATADYPTRAHRPANSVLDTASTSTLLGITPCPWRTNLRATVAMIASAGRTSS